MTVQIYVFSVVFAGVFLLIAALISNAIKYEGGANPKDPAKRKMWFWIIGLLATLTNFLFGFFNSYYPENNNYIKSQLITAIGISTAVCFILYVILGFVLSKVFKNGKLGNWF
jgi:sulfoxide reductase heme-binding subunit YedZ